MSETPETSHPSPGNSEITLDLEFELEPVSASDPHAKGSEQPAPSGPSELVDCPDGQPQASPEQPTFGEIVDGQADAQTGEASGVAGCPDSEPPG